jgi:hypothetical protein
MRGNRGRGVGLDDMVDAEMRPVRRHSGGSAKLEDARAAWEPTVCPACGVEHFDTVTVRMKRSSTGIEARCGDCGAVAAHYVDGLWSS